MTKRMMDNLYKELDAIGLEFKEVEARCWGKFSGGFDDLSTNGFLSNRTEALVTTEQLAEVLAIAKRKKTYFIVMTELEAKKGGLFVCFLQQGFFKTVEDAIPPVTRSLRRHFSYFQEDEKVMKMDEALQRLPEKLESFQDAAYDIERLTETSGHIRKAIREEGRIIEQEREIYEYMGNALEYKQAEALCNVIYCMRLTR